MEATRRYRGLVRMSLTAGILMSVVATTALGVGVVTGLVPSSIFGIRELVAVAIRAFGAGAVAGGLFALLLARGARGERLSGLSGSRVALWGGLATGGVFLLAGLAAPGVVPIGILAGAAAVAAIGGSVVSAGMLRLARRDSIALNASDRSADQRLLP